MRAKIYFLTLGCAKNEVDTDRMRALLFEADFAEVTDVAEADLAIINTCSFLESASAESIEATLELAGLERQIPIVMCGCVPSRYGAELKQELPEVAAFVRTNEEDAIVAVVEGVLNLEPLPQDSSKVMDLALRTGLSSTAYVKISDGCDRMCAFCAIPYIRGRYQSRSYKVIAKEVEKLLKDGVREIVLIGQDTGIYGSDFTAEQIASGEPTSLAQLLSALGLICMKYDAWLRVLYLQPEGMTDELISTIRDTPAVLPYIDIPIQHSSAKILKRMNRSGSEEELRELFNRLREEIPNMVLRTTGLVGFPGETQEEFEALCDFFQEMEFDYMSVFPYSQEEGTAAGGMKDQIAEEVKQERAQQLLDIATELGFSATAAHIGEEVDMIIDGVDELEDGQLEFIGHAWFQAPDCDGAIHLPEGDFKVGDKVKVRLTDSFCYELDAELV